MKNILYILLFACFTVQGQGLAELDRLRQQQVTDAGGGADTFEIASFSSTNVTDAAITLDLPTGTSADDILVVLVGSDANDATRAKWDDSTYKPTGFTLIATGGTSGSDSWVAGFYKIATGSEGSTITVPVDDNSETGVDYFAYAMRITGADSTTPLGVTGTVSPQVNQNPIVPPQITTVADNDLIICITAINGANTSPMIVTGTGWSMWQQTDGVAGDAGDVSGIITTKTQATAGATGNPDMDFTTSFSDSCSFMFSINEG